MKKVLLAAGLALAGFAGASAQEGQTAAGINLGVAPCLEGEGTPTNFGIGAKFQYNVTDPIRVEANLEYWFKAKNISVFDVAANIHYLIPIVDNVRLYPLIGIGYGNIHLSTPKLDISDIQIPNIPGVDIDDIIDAYKDAVDSSSNNSRFLFNIGCGVEYDLTENLVANFEFKYQYLKDFNRMPFQIGIAYKF